MDKHMFNKKDGTGRQVFSPQQFVEYDQARGVGRDSLWPIINEIWPGLEKASKGAKGYYWGDLLFHQPLKDQNGSYVFKANPNGITYKVEANSSVGQLMGGKRAGIAVHQYIDPNAMTTDEAVTLNGNIGQLKNNSDVAIVPSAMPTAPKLKIDNTLVKNAQNAVKKYGPAVDQLMNTAPQARNTFNQLFTVYINKKIVAGDLNNLLDGFMDFVQNRPMTDKMKAKIIEHLQIPILGSFFGWGIGGATNLENILKLLSHLGFQKVACLLDNNMIELSKEISAKFTNYHFSILPTDDIRDKKAIKAKEPIIGLVSSSGSDFKEQYREPVSEILNQINNYHKG
jgi:hypothetical protein